MRRKRSDIVKERIDRVIGEFPNYLALFKEKTPFSRSIQYSCHRTTIEIRKSFGSASAALSSDEFVHNLYETLRAWGIGGRGSRIVPRPDFMAALRARAHDIASLEDLSIDDFNQNIRTVTEKLWSVVSTLEIVENDAKLVAGSKALHHICPDLIVPIDREYTGNFFCWHPPYFQYRQRQLLDESFNAFRRIACAVGPHQYIQGEGWNTTKTKVIDNAIIGYLIREKELISEIRRLTTG